MNTSLQYTPTRRSLYLPLLVIPLFALCSSLFATPFSSTAYSETLNRNCTIIIPSEPLSAEGLATPYQLTATNQKEGACHEANPMQSAFVQGAILNPMTGQIWIYNPLVVDQGMQPTTRLRPPFGGAIPEGDIVALWFGTNGSNLALRGPNGSLQVAQCVTAGLDVSPFGQFAYCNAPAFFKAANSAIQARALIPPPLGMAKDGMVCPTVRDFSLVDQNQSNNVTTAYSITASGLIEQDTQADITALPNQAVVTGNANRLLIEVDKALGCTPWTEPDLADPGRIVSALPLNELQADMLQGEPMALIPNRGAMVLVNGQPSLAKLNAYRAGVDQPLENDSKQSNTTIYCEYLASIAPMRMQADAPLLSNWPSPDPAIANSLLTFMAQRFITTYSATGLDCIDKIKPAQGSPVEVQTDMNGVAVQASEKGVPLGNSNLQVSHTPAQATRGANQALPFDCVVNGKMVVGCTGTTTIGGQTCTFSVNANVRQITINCR